MPSLSTPNEDDVRKIVGERLAAVEAAKSMQETVTVEWRGTQIHVPVISMPVGLLHYNPGTHRLRAQITTNAKLERDVQDNPYGMSAQNYLHQLLMGDPAEPSKTDPTFLALKEDLRDHGQRDPGIITRTGVLINGNTRRAALKELGNPDMRVGVLPSDAGLEDLQSIELSLQLRKDHKREYSFMNFLLAIDERAVAGHLATRIQSDFRIKPSTYERCRWILETVRDAIKRSEYTNDKGEQISLRLIDFETHQGKLEELYRAFQTLAPKSKEEAEALKEQRLMALALNKSKTDLRLIEPKFADRYMKSSLPAVDIPPPKMVPGTTISVPGPSKEVLSLRALTTQVLRARSMSTAGGGSLSPTGVQAGQFLKKIDEELDSALDRAGKQGRIQKRRLAAVDRIGDACDDLDLAVAAVAEARATGNFDVEDVEEKLLTLKTALEKLAAIVLRGTDGDGDGVAWLRTVARDSSGR
jgi:hypothetical protein